MKIYESPAQSQNIDSNVFIGETGYAINLARDFGPRLMSYFLGYGNEVWSAGNYYFWVPMVAPFFGCLFGGWLYGMYSPSLDARVWNE